MLCDRFLCFLFSLDRDLDLCLLDLGLSWERELCLSLDLDLCLLDLTLSRDLDLCLSLECLSRDLDLWRSSDTPSLSLCWRSFSFCSSAAKSTKSLLGDRDLDLLYLGGDLLYRGGGCLAGPLQGGDLWRGGDLRLGGERRIGGDLCLLLCGGVGDLLKRKDKFYQFRTKQGCLVMQIHRNYATFSKKMLQRQSLTTHWNYPIRFATFIVKTFMYTRSYVAIF